MENLISLEQLQKNENLLRGHILTELQLQVLKKKIQNKQLNSNEKTYYYKFIKPKIKALLSLSGVEEINCRGKNVILQARMKKAKKIMQMMQNKHRKAKILISGSFLFQTEYNDIDIFIFTKYQKEDYHWKKVQITFLPERALESLFFSSLCQVSLSNFGFEPKTEFDIPLKEIMQNYELLINEIINKENYKKTLRDFLLQMEYISKKVILNPQQLYELRTKFMKRNVLELLQRYMVNNLVLSYSSKELYLLKQLIDDYKNLNKEYKESINLQYYIKTYQEVMKIAS